MYLLTVTKKVTGNALLPVIFEAHAEDGSRWGSWQNSLDAQRAIGNAVAAGEAVIVEGGRLLT